MTIKRRLFISNILMLIIPVIVSVVAVGTAAFLFWNVFYRQYMDEAYEDKDLSQMYEVLSEQAENYIEEVDEDNAVQSKNFTAMESYLDSHDARLNIYRDSVLLESIGSWSGADDEERLLAAIEILGGEGDVTFGNTTLHSEIFLVDNQTYRICFFSREHKTDSKNNEIVFSNIMIILMLTAVGTILITNRFLTKFVFRKIEKPLDVLGEGVHHIRDGNVDFRIAYSENDEFLPVCNDFNDMAERLKKSVETTKRNEQNRKELIAGISHDIRTPLTSVKAYMEGLMEGVATTPEMQQKYMEIILSKANDMDGMVDKLFLFSKLDLGECPFYPEKFDAASELIQLAEEGRPEYSSKELTLITTYVLPDAMVYADPIQFRNAVTNLIENSLKYKVNETVTVEISCVNTGDYVRITVDDDGPGVPDEAIPKLFDVFYRSDPSRNNPNKGSGLGLAITAKILERFGGKIFAENLQPHGLRVVMEIPKEACADVEDTNY